MIYLAAVNRTFFCCCFFSCIRGGYGVFVYILYGHRAISFTASNDEPLQSRRETVRKSCGHRVVFLSTVQRNCKDTIRHGAVRWLCHHRVAFSISVTNENSLSFLTEMPAKQAKGRGGKGKRSKKTQRLNKRRPLTLR